MSTTAMHPLAADYLRRLRQAGRDLPAGRLDDLCAEIESHLAEAIPAGAPDAEALSVIERLGPPEDIIEAEQPATPAPAPTAQPGGDPRTWREWAAIVLLPLGGFVFGIGWIAGVVLLWNSRAWTTRDKLIGTLIVPGGIAAILPVLLLIGHPTKYLCRQVTHNGLPAFGPGSGCSAIGGGHTGPGVLGVVLAAIIVIAPIIVAVHLARSAGRPPAEG